MDETKSLYVFSQLMRIDILKKNRKPRRLHQHKRHKIFVEFAQVVSFLFYGLTSKPNCNLTFDKRHTPHIECLCLRNKRPQNANEAQRHMKFFMVLHMNFDSFLRVWLHDMHLFRKTNSILPFDTFSVGTRPESAAFLRFTITWSSVFTSSPP